MPDWLDPVVQMIKELGSQPIVKTLDLKLVSEFPAGNHITHATYFRIFAARLIEEDEVLYLDGDIIVQQSLDQLFDLDLGDDYLAAVADPSVKDLERLHLSPEQGYFNAGVMMLNLKQWRATDFDSRVLEFIALNPKKVFFNDQCGLNAIAQGKWKKLHPKWNLQTAFFEEKSKSDCLRVFSSVQIREAMTHPSIIHFTGSNKPWNLGCEHPLKKLFWKNLDQTPFRSSLPLNFSLVNVLKSFFPESVKRSYWRYLHRKRVESKPNLGKV